MQTGRLILACLLTGTTIAAAGCGSSSAGGPETRPSPRAATVEMTDALTFTPRSIAVAQGAAVTWTNPSAVTHNVKGDGFFSRVVEPGGTYRRRFAQPGTYDYLCTFHPDMKGTVVVR